MALILGNDDAIEPLSPYAGVHPVLAERAKAYAKGQDASPRDALAHVSAEQDAWEERILNDPRNEPGVIAFCEERFAWMQAVTASGDDTYEGWTLPMVKREMCKKLQAREFGAQRIVGTITGVQDGVFRTMPNGELERVTSKQWRIEADVES